MKKILSALLVLSFLLVAAPAQASFIPAAQGQLINRSSASLTTASLTIVAANPARKYLLIHNPSAVNYGCSFGGTAAIGATGTVTLVPNQTLTIENSFIYTGALNCIAASGTNTIVVYEGQ